MKQTITALIALADKFAKLAQDYHIEKELKEIGVEYREIIECIYSVYLGGIRFDFGSSVSVTMNNTSLFEEKELRLVMEGFQLKYDILVNNLPGLVESVALKEIEMHEAAIKKLKGLMAYS